MKVTEIDINKLKAYGKNPRKNDNAVKEVANSIKEFGWKVPVVIDKDYVILAGHTRVKAANMLGLKKVPCIIADDLNEQQAKAFRLVDNKTGELANWDFDLLTEELVDLSDFDMSDFGFEMPKYEEKNIDEEKSYDYKETFEVIISCVDEEEMAEIYNRLSKEGMKCRVSTL